MAQDIQADIVESMRYATLIVTWKRMREMRVRLWIGTRLMLLTAWILNCNIEFEND